jgi:2-dehydro-3-deoxygluconokinase
MTAGRNGGAKDAGRTAGPASGFAGPGPLQIKPDGEFDLLSLGGLVIRLDTGLVPFRKATECQIYVSGAEYNVAANVSDCFGLRTAVASAMVEYPVGDLVAERVRAMGVTGLYRHFEHDGVAGPNIATVYSDRGVGMRPPVVFYNRANEAAAMLRAGDFDWQSIFDRGVRWFHSGGLFAALSETTPDVLLEAVAAARSHGTVVSCDLNYRAKLWARLGGVARAREVMSRVVDKVDVLVGNEEDVELSLGIAQPDATRSPDLDQGAFEAVSEQIVERYPNVKLVATTLRRVVSASRHQWTAVVWADGRLHQAPTMDLDVYDRVGGGDGFASGLFYGLLAGLSVEESLRLGWAHGALLTSYPGDTTMATLAQVKALASGGSARIQR